MSMPGVYDLTLPVLQELSDGAIHTTGELAATLASQMHLSERELSRTRSDGRPLFKNRVEWARTHLKKAGFVEYPELCACRITPRGLRLLACDPRHLGPEFLVNGGTDTPAESPEQSAMKQSVSLEQELRLLTGDPARAEREWNIIRQLNGWGPNPPASYERVAKDVGSSRNEILKLGRACRRSRPASAPMLDSAIRLVLEHPEHDPQKLALMLATAGITDGAFNLAGLCEAARRFGRFEEWAALIRQLAASKTSSTLPRPFGSWFEVDVYLYVAGLGHRAIPQQRIGNYKVDMLLPDFVPQLVIECDGDRYHGESRRAQDEKRERDLLDRGYRLVRFRYSVYVAKPHSIKQGLVEILSQS